MKKLKIYSIISNYDNETTTYETIADYDEENNIFKYNEDDLKVTIEVFDDKVTISRKNDDYSLELEFVEQEKVNCNYEVKSLGLFLDIEVYTKVLEISENIIYIEYELFNNNKSIGTFEYKLMFMEEL